MVSAGDATAERVLREVGSTPVWIHIDWDVLEPGFVPAAYRVPGGLAPDRLSGILSGLTSNRIVGVEVAEFEATGDDGRDSAAVTRMMEILAPILTGRA